MLAQNICDEEFQRVSRTIFIKTKIIVITLIISTQIVNNDKILPSYNSFKHLVEIFIFSSTEIPIIIFEKIKCVASIFCSNKVIMCGGGEILKKIIS